MFSDTAPRGLFVFAAGRDKTFCFRTLSDAYERFAIHVIWGKLQACVSVRTFCHMFRCCCWHIFLDLALCDCPYTIGERYLFSPCSSISFLPWPNHVFWSSCRVMLILLFSGICFPPGPARFHEHVVREIFKKDCCEHMFLIRSPDSFSFSCPAPQAPCIVISVLSGRMFLDMASGQFAHSLRTFFGFVWLLLSCLASLVWLGLLSLAWPPRFGLADLVWPACCEDPARMCQTVASWGDSGWIS